MSDLESITGKLDAAYAKRRADAAYWFAAGHYEASDGAGQDHSDDFRRFAGDQAMDYRTGKRSYLPSILSQWAEYIEAHI